MNPECAWHEMLPECCECGKRIEDVTCYQINGEAVCEACVEQMRTYTTDMMG